jgi:four helix bundle protein
MRVAHFRDLTTWQLANELRREVFAFTANGRASGDFRYCNQIRDAAGSACRNTSEGFDRFRPSEFARFLEFARGSLGEVQDGLVEAHQRQFISGESFDRLWLLSKRAIGANTNLLKYLQRCVDNGDAPWRQKRKSDPGTSDPNREPGTREPGT